MENYLSVLQKYAVFEGRASRKEFWMFYLFNLIANVILWILSLIGLGFLSYIYALFILVPSLAVGVRRLHDINKSGWWMFIAFIPIIGAIWLIILWAMEGTGGPNNYGSEPSV
jgi:uncharacterized membrane protein YhaH (DUF805 family)